MTKEREIEVLELILVYLKEGPGGYFRQASGLCGLISYLLDNKEVSMPENHYVRSRLRAFHLRQGGKMDNDGFWFPPFETEPRIKLIEERLKILQS